ncbi:MAG TPA: inositol monophosphatase family protein [Anaerolineales bacterium]|nr:inositol monophosphatase family protein [Anaerolineales bacterium]
MTDIAAFIDRLSRETGRLLKGYFRAEAGTEARESRYKPDRTLLTQADLASNAFISGQIREQFPDDDILSEEAVTAFPLDGRPTWIVDPLDGTTNFEQGLHHWGVSIARVVDGRPQAAALAFPLLDECFTAFAGGGARLNGRQLQVPPAGSHLVSFFLCDSRVNRGYTAEIPYKPRILGSAAYNFCAVAKGSAVIGFESIPRIWDIAASWLVLKEAGGAVAALNGPVFPLEPGKDYGRFPIPLIGAADEGLLAEAIGKIVLKK